MHAHVCTQTHQEFARGVDDGDVAALAGEALREANLNGAASTKCFAPRTLRACFVLRVLPGERTNLHTGSVAR
jgi:hypothetical protein